jgi:hypothetical protein
MLDTATDEIRLALLKGSSLGQHLVQHRTRASGEVAAITSLMNLIYLYINKKTTAGHRH